MPRKTFVAGEVLAAADVNTYLMDQAVMTFAGSAARGSAIASPSEGMVSYLEDTDSVEVYDSTNWVAVGASQTGNVIQVVSTTKTDTFTTTSTSFVDITGLSASITPSSASNKILVIVAVEGATTNGTANSIGGFKLLRDSTDIAIGDAAGSRTRATSGISTRLTSSSGITTGVAKSFLDSPSATSSTTYKVQTSVQGGTLFVNRTEDDSDAVASHRMISTITLMEIAG